jgi:hypothetical protein
MWRGNMKIMKNNQRHRRNENGVGGGAGVAAKVKIISMAAKWHGVKAYRRSAAQRK